MFWCQSQVYLGNARFRPGARTPFIYFNLHLSGNVLGQLFPWNLLINKTKSILLSFLQDAHLYESLICLYLSNFLATSYKIKILDYKNFGVRSKPWVCPRQKHVPFSLCISLEKSQPIFWHIKKLVSGFHGLSGMFIYTKKHVIKSGDIITNSFPVSNVKKAKWSNPKEYHKTLGKQLYVQGNSLELKF